MRALKMGFSLLALASLFGFAQEPSADKSSLKPAVYVYRYKQFVGSALAPSVYCDDAQLARMENGRYFSVRLDPGMHTLRSNDTQSGIQLEVKPGQEYFIRVEIAAGMMKGHGRLILTPQEQGRYELQSSKLKPLDDGKVVDKTRVSVDEVKFDKAPAAVVPVAMKTAPIVVPAGAPQATTPVESKPERVVLSDDAPDGSNQMSLGDAARKAREKKTGGDSPATPPQ